MYLRYIILSKINMQENNPNRDEQDTHEVVRYPKPDNKIKGRKYSGIRILGPLEQDAIPIDPQYLAMIRALNK